MGVVYYAKYIEVAMVHIIYVTGSTKRGLIAFLRILNYHLHITPNNSGILGVFVDQVSKQSQIHKSSYGISNMCNWDQL